MKKRWIAVLMAGVCAVGFTLGAVADDFIDDIEAQLRRDFTVKVDGEVKEFKNKQGDVVYPLLYDGTTYLPLRAIGELMGKTVFWYENDKRIELKDTTVTDADVIVDGVQKTENANNDKTKFIGEDKARKIALKTAGFDADDVKFWRVELDKDDGVYVYEIEFRTGEVEYDMYIGAVNGAVLKWEIDKEGNRWTADYDTTRPAPPDIIYDEKTVAPAVEFITKDEAKAIALKKAGIDAEGVVFEDFELDSDDGVHHYEIEFRKGDVEYEIDIKADDGSILKWEADKN